MTSTFGTIKKWASMLARCYGSPEAAYDFLTKERWWTDVRTEELLKDVTHWDMEEERQMLREELGVMAFASEFVVGRDLGDEA